MRNFSGNPKEFQILALAALSQAAGKGKKPKKPRKAAKESEAEPSAAEAPGGDALKERLISNGEASTSAPRVTSSNAYMLMYRRKEQGESSPVDLPPR